jgi:hypothetical protein
MPHRASKKERKKAISDIPDIPGGPFWRRLGPYGPAIPLIPKLAKELAKVLIEHEEFVGLGDPAGHGVPAYDWDAAVRKEQQEARWAAMEESKPVRKKRKVSDYSKQFGIILKALKKKHPRTPVTRLMKRAHVATKKKMPKPGKGRLSKGRRTIAKSGQFRRDKILPRWK